MYIFYIFTIVSILAFIYITYVENGRDIILTIKQYSAIVISFAWMFICAGLSNNGFIIVSVLGLLLWLYLFTRISFERPISAINKELKRDISAILEANKNNKDYTNQKAFRQSQENTK
jgi:uncharacterized protein (DUF58 family)